MQQSLLFSLRIEFVHASESHRRPSFAQVHLINSPFLLCKQAAVPVIKSLFDFFTFKIKVPTNRLHFMIWLYSNVERERESEYGNLSCSRH